MDSDNVIKSLCSPFQNALLPREAALPEPFSYSQSGDCPAAERIILQCPWQLGLVIFLSFLFAAGHTTWRSTRVLTFGQDSSREASHAFMVQGDTFPTFLEFTVSMWLLLAWGFFFFFKSFSVLFLNKRNSETCKFCEISNPSVMYLLCAPLLPLPPPWAGSQCWFPTPGHQALEASRGQLPVLAPGPAQQTRNN